MLDVSSSCMVIGTKVWPLTHSTIFLHVGNLLDDTELIDVLAVTKQTAQDVAEKLANASETNKKINEACEEYRPVAHRATLVYFLIAEFSVVNCMYQTSLAQFNQLYELSMDRSDKANMPSKRINNIIEYLTYEIYLYIQRGLFERHKIIFALMLTNKILLSAGKIRAVDLDVFLKGGGALDINSIRKKPKVSEWAAVACILTQGLQCAWCLLFQPWILPQTFLCFPGLDP